MSKNRMSHVLTYLAPQKWTGNMHKLLNLIRRLSLFSQRQQISTPVGSQITGNNP